MNCVEIMNESGSAAFLELAENLQLEKMGANLVEEIIAKISLFIQKSPPKN